LVTLSQASCIGRFIARPAKATGPPLPWDGLGVAVDEEMVVLLGAKWQERHVSCSGPL
jgi:hypothetical protein